MADEKRVSMAYKCGRCKKRIEFDAGNIGIRCPYCGSKVFYKERPTVAKRIKSY